MALSKASAPGNSRTRHWLRRTIGALIHAQAVIDEFETILRTVEQLSELPGQIAAAEREVVRREQATARVSEQRLANAQEVLDMTVLTASITAPAEWQERRRAQAPARPPLADGYGTWQRRVSRFQHHRWPR